MSSTIHQLRNFLGGKIQLQVSAYFKVGIRKVREFGLQLLQKIIVDLIEMGGELIPVRFIFSKRNQVPM